MGCVRLMPWCRARGTERYTGGTTDPLVLLPPGEEPVRRCLPILAELLQRLLAYLGLPAMSHVPALEDTPSLVLAMHFQKGQTSLRLFTTIATLGTPQDVADTGHGGCRAG